ncbi:Uncharacterized protein FWK35_00022082 [Aphis craccivora]|uniref:Uncharacterized protein n=1 Tax=Aphis craccivora TaxID=307492 RepID=A0A6G0YQD9_APHCR|nr:Uncharacterized protein FWK35_00022082 [Aphis craccivora]
MRVVSDVKVNILGALYRSKVIIFQQFSKNQENKKKNDGKTDIFTQNQFSTKSIFYMVVIQKLITVNT